MALRFFLGLYINSIMRTWEDASRSCILVGSDRSPPYDVNAREIPNLNSISRGDNNSNKTLYWIGATANFTPWFELLGNDEMVICLFVCVFRPDSRTFHSYGDVTITRGELQVLTYTKYS